MFRKERDWTHLPKKAWEYSENAYLRTPAASPSDFTGLAPIVPETVEEADALQQVMPPAPVTSKDDSAHES